MAEHKLNDRKQDWKLDVLSAIVLANSCLIGPGIVNITTTINTTTDFGFCLTGIFIQRSLQVMPGPPRASQRRTLQIAVVT